MHTAISWFTRNPVAANLLMWILIVAGVMGLLIVNQEDLPNFDIQVVNVSVPYLGAAPEEVEQGVCIRVEEALEGLEGIDKLHSTANEGQCTVLAELNLEADEVVALNEIKSRVDGINSFPAETEKPIVSKLTMSREVLQIAISGDADERSLKEIGREIRDNIAAIDGISQVSLTYVRPYEISIEVSENTLRRYGLTLEQVAHAIRSTSLDLPGGTIKTQGGEILIRTKGQAYWGEEFENIVVMTRADGTKVTLAEIADIRDDFAEGDLLARFNAQPGVIVKVMQVGTENLPTIAREVKAYVDEAHTILPEGLQMTIWTDRSLGLAARMNILNMNAAGGLLLVLVVLTLFLRFRLAMWVAAGIPIALLGTFAVFPYAGITMSTMTIMAFILVLGVLVDDAIVVGERVYSHEQMGKPPIQAAIDGTWEVSVPVIFGVLTTMAAFLPLVIVPGRMTDFFAVIGHVVIISLVFSIIESQLILPAHLAHRNHEESDHGFAKWWNDLQGRLSDWLQNLANYYVPFLARAIEWRYVTTAVGVGILIMAVALIASDRVVFGFFPAVEGDRIYATLEMPDGVTIAATTRAAEQIEEGARLLSDELAHSLGVDYPVVTNQLTSIGAIVNRSGPPRQFGPGRSNYAEIVIELVPLAKRNNMSAKEVANRWRELAGDIPDAVKLSFNADMFSAGEPINYQLSGEDVDQLRTAAEELKAELTRYDGVFDITDSFRAGKQEIKLSLLPEARNLGLTLNDLARQVRSAFYGSEVQRMQRMQDEVKVMVRYPESERTSIGNLEDMYIRTPDGSEVPFYSVARFDIGRGYSSIHRTEGMRVINITAEVDRTTVAP
ncbi:MAG: efflux RND transporter permease subunit, partial [Pseudomonadales bacterium]|nr:efflux RND transporter permease subunit [Pseudomonadales bacterium]